GENGKIETNKDGKKRSIAADELGFKPAKNGCDLYLTIDERIQYIVEKELEKTFLDFKAKGAVAVVMNVQTGEVLALANRPGYDPNNLKMATVSGMKNQAVNMAYEPGSIFKIIALAAGLSEKVTTENEIIDCENGSFEVYNHKINDHIKYKMLSFRQVIELSSNIGTAKMGARLGPEKLYKCAKSFGFGEKTNIQLAGEIRGTLRPVEKWSGLSPYIMPIGQEVSATGIQLISAMNAVANKGKYMQPLIVKYIKDNEGRTIKEFAPVELRQAVDEATARRMTAVLRGVVENGTGKEAGVEGISVAGKTGTAQKFDPVTRKYSTYKYVSSFIGFVPAEKPKIAILVSIDEPNGVYWGGSVAAPCFSKIAKQALRYMEKESYDLVKNN
ncbi:MAG: penicillin-binding protein 2, partial [Candidatus Firestonebacteria bacterium]